MSEASKPRPSEVFYNALPESRTGGWKVHRRGERTKDEGMGRVVGDDAGREVVCGQVDYHLT